MVANKVMQKMLSDSKLAMVEWRMAIFWGFLFILNTIGSSYVGEFNDYNWDESTKSKLVLKIFCMLNQVTTVMMAFISKSSKKISSGIMPFDDTTLLTSSTAQTKNETTNNSTTPAV